MKSFNKFLLEIKIKIKEISMRTHNIDTIAVNTLIINTIDTHANTITNPIDELILDINPNQIHQDEQEPIFL